MTPAALACALAGLDTVATPILTPIPPPDSARLDKAEAARRAGDHLALYDLAQAAIADGDPDPRFRYLQTLALARLGDTRRAEQLYETYRLGERDDEDALALRGRLLKDRALSASGEEARQGFQAASQAYLQASRVRSGNFPLINAATTAWAAGDVERARELARRVLDHADPNAENDFFTAASFAEALILLGRMDRADQTLAAALARGTVGHGDRAACYRQLE